MKRIPLVCANLKMNPLPAGWDKKNSPYYCTDNVEVAIFPGFVDIDMCLWKKLAVGGQCARAEETGAFTGDISMKQLADHKCQYVLCGHSERRVHHNENDEAIAEQVKAALKAGLIPVWCVGESADEREMGNTEEVIERQLSSFQAIEQNVEKIIIAYEPVWAIGTGKTATPQIAEEVHSFIRSLLPAKVKDSIRILYGGSVKPDNAPALIKEKNIDGFLVGGASLDIDSFAAIVDCCGKKA